MHPVKLLERAASGAAHAIRHPISSAAYAAGMARGLAGAALHGATVNGHDPGARRTSDTTPHMPTQRRAPAGEYDDVPPPEPTPLHESFATEPKATSRQSEHGRPASDEEIDAWIDEAMARGGGTEDVDIETPVGTTGVSAGYNPDTAEADLQQPGTEPLMDPSTTKAVKSESDMLRKDAERDPE
jgi:hypothetical protein